MCGTSEETSYEILSYLVNHPDALDTLEGVAEWWVFAEKIRRGTLQVEQALAELVSKGLVIERKGRDGRSHYRVNRRKLREISSILKQSPHNE
jgi:predicted transcriptional regulator